MDRVGAGGREGSPECPGLFTLGRLKPGVDLSQARTELLSVTARLANEYPATNEGWSALAAPAAEEFTPDDVRLVIWTMMGAVTLVLMIACANVANLMLARASMRQREFSVRAAIGAGRGRMIRQLLTECVLLGLMSAPLGLAIAYLGTWMLDRAVPPDDIPYYIHWEISPRVMAYTIAVSALTGILFGLAPALQAGRLNLVEALRDGGRGSGQSGRRARVRNGLVIAEVALALVLLVGASLFIRSFFNLQSANPGFDTSPLLTLRFYLTGDAYVENQQRFNAWRTSSGASRHCRAWSRPSRRTSFRSTAVAVAGPRSSMGVRFHVARSRGSDSPRSHRIC